MTPTPCGSISRRGSDAVYAYDLGTGKSIPPAQVVPATDADLRGTAKRLVLPPGGAVEARRGPGDYGLVGGDGGQLVAYDAATRRRIPLKGVVGSGFKLVRWQDGTTFFGVALGEDGNPLAVMSCNLEQAQLHQGRRAGSGPLAGLRERRLTTAPDQGPRRAGLRRFASSRG